MIQYTIGLYIETRKSKIQDHYAEMLAFKNELSSSPLLEDPEAVQAAVRTQMEKRAKMN